MISTAITIQDTIAKFSAVTGCTFVSLNLCTIPKLTGGKSNVMQGKIRKFSTFTAFCGSGVSYEKMVNKKAVSEFKDIIGEKPVNVRPFKAESMWKGFGQHVAGAVIRHTGTDDKYLYFYVPSNSKPVVWYELDEKEIQKSEIIGLESSDDTKEVIVDGLAVEVEMVVRTAKLASVRGFRMDGTNYMVVENIVL